LGQAKPTVNEHSWTNLSSILWVEQPVGTGFSQGVPNAQNEDDVAAQLVGFMQQFLEVFSELKGKQLYLTGESVSFSERLSRHHTHCTSTQEHTSLVSLSLFF
jgi:carboxypeptidase D